MKVAEYYSTLYSELGSVDAVEAALYSAPHQCQRRVWINAELKALAGPETVALDLGCCGGWYTAELAKYCKAVIGVDIVGWLIEQAPQFENVRYIVSDWNEVNFDAETFDLILATEVFEHEPQYADLAIRLWRWTKSRGELVVTIPINENYLPARWAFDITGLKRPKMIGHGSGHVWLPRPWEFVQFLQSMGWEVIKQESDGIFLLVIGRKTI